MPTDKPLSEHSVCRGEYRWRRVDVEKGRMLWCATPIHSTGSAYDGMDLEGRVFYGFTKRQALRRARRAAIRWQRREDKRNSSRDDLWIGGCCS